MDHYEPWELITTGYVDTSTHHHPSPTIMAAGSPSWGKGLGVDETNLRGRRHRQVRALGPGRGPGGGGQGWPKGAPQELPGPFTGRTKNVVNVTG